MGIMISIGKWGGIYFARAWSWRLCLGWIAFSFFPTDGDNIIALATKATKFSQALNEIEYMGRGAPKNNTRAQCMGDIARTVLAKSEKND